MFPIFARWSIQAPYTAGLVAPQPCRNTINGDTPGSERPGSNSQYAPAPSPKRTFVTAIRSACALPGPRVACGGGVGKSAAATRPNTVHNSTALIQLVPRMSSSFGNMPRSPRLTQAINSQSPPPLYAELPTSKSAVKCSYLSFRLGKALRLKRRADNNKREESDRAQ